MGKVKATIAVDIETRGLHDDALDAGIIFIEAAEQDMWWTTLKGENIRIDKMDTEHLKNTIAMLKRNGRYRMKRTAGIFRNMQIEYYRRQGPAGEVLFGKSKI